MTLVLPLAGARPRAPLALPARLRHHAPRRGAHAARRGSVATVPRLRRGCAARADDIHFDDNGDCCDEITYDALHLAAPDGRSLDAHGARAEGQVDLFAADASEQVSRSYAWLPADVAIADNGSATFESYINNLHPGAHAPLYAALERLLTACVPLLEATQRHAAPLVGHKAISFDMATLRSGTGKARSGSDDGDSGNVSSAGADGGASNEAGGVPNSPTADGVDDDDSDPQHEVSHQSKDDDNNNDEYDLGPILSLPCVPDAYKPPELPADQPGLRGSTLQVIAKIAEIVLTPEKPQYPGGAWHLEGMVNEHIAASIVAYVESVNIAASELAFRVAVDTTLMDYEQDDHAGVEAVYGLRNGEPVTRAMGAVQTLAGRVVCFPNMLQHRMQPFQLADPSRGGVRKIVVFFVVDPATRVPSTRTVPPQQEAWWWPQGTREVLRAQLPQELAGRVEARVGTPMTHAQALKHREALMQERAAKRGVLNNDVCEEEFSLCEH
jgi:Protein of unknown function (DUF4246)